MHSKAQAHSSTFHMNCNPAHVALVILITLLFLVFLFLFLNLTAQPALAQNSVPPTARQAATMPQFAAKLAHGASRVPGQPHASYKNPMSALAQGHRSGPLDANTLYENGPINGTTDAWDINFGFVVSNTFTIPASSSVTGLTFGAWAFPGDTLQTAEVSITSSEFGGTTYFDGVVNFTQSGCSGNQYGYNVCTEAGTFTLSNLDQGTYWVNLQNAVTAAGNPVYWDENSGVGCQSSGCPSLASENAMGTIPAEAFTLLGTTTGSSCEYGCETAPCPSPQSNFQDVHDFDPGAGPSGLAIDVAGKLYGTLANAGSHGAGTLYALAQSAGHWFVTSLYNFLGGSSGSSPNGVIVGPGGILYGSAAGGIQNCGLHGNDACGLIYEATPSMTPCRTALCSWNVTTIYQFTGGTDAWGGQVTAFDSAGNLYGFGNGGAYGRGAVFELSPSQGGGWTETIIHNFTGGSDGASPGSLLMGGDGNLYGTAAAGGMNWNGVIFQFVPSDGGWTENSIYSFTGGASDGAGPGGLIQGGPGNFYGTGVCASWGQGYCYDGGEEYDGTVWSLSNSGEGWAVNVLHVYRDGECPFSSYGSYHGLAFGPQGHLYALESAGIRYLCGGVLDVSSGGLVIYGPPAFGNLTSDAIGNLYGTMSTCGFGTPSRTDSMVWQISPQSYGLRPQPKAAP